MKKILIAGIGNVFLGDDGFGVEVIRRLAGRRLPDGAVAIDFGIRGIDLTYALMDGYDAAVLVDVAMRGEPPGTLYVIEPAVEAAREPHAALATHGMDPARVLGLVATLGGAVGAIRVVACEPAVLGDEADVVVGLSPAVAAAVEPACQLALELAAALAAADGAEAPARATGGPLDA
jgi:hydrogenase maturation protease